MNREMLFSASDLLAFDEGPAMLQAEKRKRVAACLFELGRIISGQRRYMGPRLDDTTLGTLGPGQFFGELVLFINIVLPNELRAAHPIVERRVSYQLRMVGGIAVLQWLSRTQ